MKNPLKTFGSVGFLLILLGWVGEDSLVWARGGSFGAGVRLSPGMGGGSMGGGGGGHMGGPTGGGPAGGGPVGSGFAGGGHGGGGHMGGGHMGGGYMGGGHMGGGTGEVVIRAVTGITIIRA